VDVATKDQLGAVAALPIKIAFMLDHHEVGQPFADHLVISRAAAAGEIVYAVAEELIARGALPYIPKKAKIALYAALSSDTGCFRYSNVTPETHLRASELVASGIDCALVNQKMFEQKTLEQLRAQAAGISNLHLFADGKIAVVLFPYALKAALGLEEEHLGTLVDVARSLRGVEVALSIRQPSIEGKFRVSVRCTGDFDAAALCAQFEGGGHKKAAGCTVIAESVDEAMNKILSAMNFPQDN
jgi:phosphoesterase RecJ-like protein